MLLGLKAAVDTKTAKSGDTVYLTSTFPVIVGDRVVIPAGMDVLGVIDSVVRPGRVKGRAKVSMHFTTLILPNGSVVQIPGSVNALPGAGGPTVKGQENTVEQASTAGRDAHNIEGATAAGAGVGGLAGLGGGNAAPGVGYGALAGGAGGVIYTLLTRGDDVTLQPGQALEMELQRPLVLQGKDVYVPPATEDLGKVSDEVSRLIPKLKVPENVRINVRGMVQGMNASFHSFAIGLSLSVVLLYLILVAQFKSFKDPFLIMLAIPMGFIGVLVILPLTGTTLNVMSLMGVLMLVGISASNSILIVEFTHRLEEQGKGIEEAVITSCRVRLRPILMTSLATIIGMVPMALKLGTGSEQYAPLARAIIGGLTVSVVLTVFIVPAAYLIAYRSRSAG